MNFKYWPNVQFSQSAKVNQYVMILPHKKALQESHTKSYPINMY